MARFSSGEILKSRRSDRPQPGGTCSGPGPAPRRPESSLHARPTTAGQAGGNQMRLKKSMTVLAAMAMGATTALAGTTAAQAAPAAGGCVTDKLLVPSCGVLWGAAAGGFTDAPRDQALKDFEKLSGRTASIYH